MVQTSSGCLLVLPTIQGVIHAAFGGLASAVDRCVCLVGLQNGLKKKYIRLQRATLPNATLPIMQQRKHKIDSEYHPSSNSI